jgi:preprotein translocase subunit SecE
MYEVDAREDEARVPLVVVVVVVVIIVIALIVNDAFVALLSSLV